MKHIGVILGATIGPVTSILVAISIGVLIYKLKCQKRETSNQQTNEKDDNSRVGGIERNEAATGMRTEEKPGDDDGRQKLIKTLEELKYGITSAFESGGIICTEGTYV